MAFEPFQPAPVHVVWPGVAARVADPRGIDPDLTFTKKTRSDPIKETKIRPSRKTGSDHRNSDPVL